MRVRTLQAAALLTTLALAGCIEDKTTIKLEPDGKGTLKMERKLGKQMTEMLLAFAGKDGKDKAVRNVAAQQLGQLEGVVAWTDIDAKLTDDNRVLISGTAWFEDMTALVRAQDGKKKPLLVVDKKGESVEITLKQEQDGVGGGPGGGDDKSFFDRDPAEIEMMKGMLKGMVEGMFEGLRVEMALELPGPATESAGWTTKDGERKMSFVLDSKAVTGMVEKMLAVADELRPKVEKGELTKEQADAEVKRRAGEGLEPRVKYSPRPDGARPDFAKQLAAAVESWNASPWKAEVEEARKNADKPMSFGPPDEPVPEGLTRTEPDALEPNDDAASAKKLEPGKHENLMLEEGGEDWYRLDCPQGKELRITARFDAAQGDIDAELQDPEGRTLRQSMGMGNVERVRIAAAKAPGVYLLRLMNGKNAYHLEVELLDYVPVDAFEPNDGRLEAAKVEAGKHEKLVCNGEDWYRFEAPAGKLVDIEIAFESDKGDLELSIETEFAMPVTESRGMGSEERVRFLMPSDPILVRVFNGTDVPYSMKVTVGEPPKPDAFEPNDDPSQAKPIKAGKTGDLVLESEDWFTLDVAKGKQYRVVLAKTDKTAPGDLQVTLHAPGKGEGDAPQELISAQVILDEPATIVVARPEAGPVLLHVQGGVVAYSIDVVEEAFTAADPYEPNEFRLDARPIKPGKHEKLVCTGADWYKVEVPAGKKLIISVKFKNEADGDLDLDIQDEEGNYVGSSNGTEDEERVEVDTDESARVVCVGVKSVQRERKVPYVMELKLE